MNFTTREPSARDAAEIADLHVSTWREAYSHLLPEDFFTEEYIAGRHKMWIHVLANPTDETVVRVAERWIDHRFRVGGTRAGSCGWRSSARSPSLRDLRRRLPPRLRRGTGAPRRNTGRRAGTPLGGQGESPRHRVLPPQWIQVRRHRVFRPYGASDHRRPDGALERLACAGPLLPRWQAPGRVE